MQLPELKKLMKENKIKGISYLNKPEIIQKLIEHKVLAEKPKNKEKEEKMIDENLRRRLKNIRNNPRRVEILDKETGEVTVYPSLHKAGRSLGQSQNWLVYMMERY